MASTYALVVACVDAVGVATARVPPIEDAVATNRAPPIPTPPATFSAPVAVVVDGVVDVMTTSPDEVSEVSVPSNVIVGCDELMEMVDPDFVSPVPAVI